MKRRNFIKTASIGTAATILADKHYFGSTLNRQVASSQLKKAVLITMLPKEMSYLDRFKLAVDVGFQGIEAQTITEQREADQIKEASIKANIPIHSVMNMGHWEWPLSSTNPDDVTKSIQRMEISLRNAKLWGAET